jgi:hypothetical protein
LAAPVPFKDRTDGYVACTERSNNLDKTNPDDQEKNKTCEPSNHLNEMELDPTITKPLPVCR